MPVQEVSREIVALAIFSFGVRRLDAAFRLQPLLGQTRCFLLFAVQERDDDLAAAGGSLQSYVWEWFGPEKRRQAAALPNRACESKDSPLQNRGGGAWLVGWFAGAVELDVCEIRRRMRYGYC
jgi:hypothetical protein